MGWNGFKGAADQPLHDFRDGAAAAAREPFNLGEELGVHFEIQSLREAQGIECNDGVIHSGNRPKTSGRWMTSEG